MFHLTDRKSFAAAVLLFCLVLLDIIYITKAAVHQSLGEARSERQRLVQKYIKTLNKEEGAIRLVGGDTEFEGSS